jgi:hypothetical protein
VAPAVSSRSLAAEVPVQSYASLCRLRFGQCGTGAGFFCKYCDVPLSVSYQCSVFIHASITDANTVNNMAVSSSNTLKNRLSYMTSR